MSDQATTTAPGFINRETFRGRLCADCRAKYDAPDRNGGFVACADCRHVVELFRRSPEMEATIRGLEWSAIVASGANVSTDCCPRCSRSIAQGHLSGCQIGDLLAALDAARRGT